MTNLMKIEQQLKMTTLDIAELTCKRHDHVMSDTRKMLKELELYAPDFMGTYTTAQGNKYECFTLPKRETMILVSGYNLIMRAKIIDRWQELEGQLSQPKPLSLLPDFNNPILMARTWADNQEALQEKDKQLALAAPKVDFVDQYVDTTGKTTFRQLAKILQVNERRLRHFLKDNKIMYQLNDEWVGYSKYMKNGMLETVTGFNKDMCRSFTTTVFTPKGVNHVASYWKK